MKKLLLPVFSCAFLLMSSISFAQNYQYNSVQKNFVYSEGFGINHPKKLIKTGNILIQSNTVSIDGDVYVMINKGLFRNSEGKAVKIGYGYEGKTIGSITVVSGNTINEYLIEPNAAEMLAAKKEEATIATK